MGCECPTIDFNTKTPPAHSGAGGVFLYQRGNQAWATSSGVTKALVMTKPIT